MILPGVFSCSCYVGYTGTACETLINLCSPNPCQNNGNCIMSAPNQITCSCQTPWTGVYCTQYTSSCSSTYCSNGGTCYEITPGVPACYCPPCYTGAICQLPVDLCGVGSANPCLNGGNCISNQPNSCTYSCTCPSGFYFIIREKILILIFRIF